MGRRWSGHAGERARGGATTETATREPTLTLSLGVVLFADRSCDDGVYGTDRAVGFPAQSSLAHDEDLGSRLETDEMDRHRGHATQYWLHGVKHAQHMALQCLARSHLLLHHQRDLLANG